MRTWTTHQLLAVLVLEEVQEAACQEGCQQAWISTTLGTLNCKTCSTICPSSSLCRYEMFSEKFGFHLISSCQLFGGSLGGGNASGLASLLGGAGGPRVRQVGILLHFCSLRFHFELNISSLYSKQCIVCTCHCKNYVEIGFLYFSLACSNNTSASI